MAKRKFGTFEMTDGERVIFNEFCVSRNLREHYEEMAQKYAREDARREAAFWGEVRKRDLPKSPYLVRISSTWRHIIVEKDPNPPEIGIRRMPRTPPED